MAERGLRMNIWNGMDALPDGLGAVVASIGKCDGVHLGHREILRRVVAEAQRDGLPALLISFDPHPTAVLAPDRMPSLLQTRRQKMTSLEQTGITDFLILDFDESLAALSGERFFSELLLPGLKITSVSVGETFRFGHERAGDVKLLSEIGEREGFAVHGVPPVVLDGEIISSSAIRTAIEQGDPELAQRMLGRPYEVSGEVIEGSGRGRELQFPTANLLLDNELLPRSGVYVTETVALASRHPSVTNVGVRPTFGGRVLAVETHLLEFFDDLYTERVDVRFLARVRDEMRFDNVVELADQIARDRAAALSYFQHARIEISR
jgi:riboflavin kinase/FMN adenylyltransferase